MSNSRKQRLFTAVERLHARDLTDAEIGAFVGLSGQRVNQIVTLLRLKPPRSEWTCFGDACAWLACEVPDLERECRYLRNDEDGPEPGNFQNETGSQAEGKKAA